MSDDHGTEPLPLPGLELPDETRRQVSDLERGVRRTIAAHADLEHISEVDAGKCALALELCHVAQVKRAGRRLSTVHADLRLLSEILDSFAPDAGGDDVDARLRKAMAEWEAVMESDNAGAAADSGPEVRNPA